MKKLISAASALAMAASMVGASVPFATGAADSSKGFALRVFDNKNGTTPSTTIDTSAGSVTIPVGVYYIEKEADTASIRASFCVTSENGNASNDYVKFTSIYQPSDYDPYFTSPREVVTKDGTFNTGKLIGFAGTLEEVDDDEFEFYEYGTTNYAVADKQESQKVTTAYGSAIWIKPLSQQYKWSDKNASDTYPMYVFDVTFAQGTPAGEYKIDFIDYVLNPAYPDINATMVEADGGKFYINKGITKTPLTITVAGEVAQQPTEAPVVTPTQAPTEPTVTPGPGGDVTSDFVVTGDNVTGQPGETVKVNFKVQSGGHPSAKLSFIPAAAPAGITYELKYKRCVAVPGSPMWELMGDTYYCDTYDKVAGATAGDPQNFTDGDSVLRLDYTLPTDIAPGVYPVTLDMFHVVENGKEGQVKEFDAKIVAGSITVEGGETTPTEAPTAAPTDAPTTPPTQAPTEVQPTQGDDQPSLTPNYGDVNVDGKVNIADVVVLNKWINSNDAYDLTPQGKLNADCCDAAAGTPDENDSLAIIKSIVHLVKALPCTSADLK